MRLIGYFLRGFATWRKSLSLNIRLPGCWPFSVEWNWSHWQRKGTRHGLKSMPRIFAATFCRLPVQRPSIGWRVWWYFRGGYAFHFDFYLDKRST